jgi:DNA-binding Lrp family transcriptional regulator
MDIKLDNIDFAIITSLMEDGRKSFRQISREINVSTPTVEIRFKRLKESRIIKGVQPIFDLEKFKNIILSIFYIKIDSSKSEIVIQELESFSEITNLYFATGEYNLIAKSISYEQSQLENIRHRISNVKGIESLYCQILYKTLKDELVFPMQKENVMKIPCEICGMDIQSFHFKIKVNNSEKYLCCSSCLTLYKQKHNLNI